jgi:hypothetical protein
MSAQVSSMMTTMMVSTHSSNLTLNGMMPVMVNTVQVPDSVVVVSVHVASMDIHVVFMTSQSSSPSSVMGMAYNVTASYSQLVPEESPLP